MDRLRDFVSEIIGAYDGTSFSRAVGTVHAENAVWRAGREEWEAARWEALQAADADPLNWGALHHFVHQARKRAHREPPADWDGITYRPVF